jgi:hypothetical protein
VVRQLPVEMLQQCLGVSSCMLTYIVMEEHYTTCQHSTPLVLNGPTQFFLVFCDTNCGWAHRWQPSLTQAYRNLFPDMTSASILVVTTLRRSLCMYVCMYVCFVYNHFFFSLLVLLTAHQRLLSE